jgi:hypothetical protein
MHRPGRPTPPPPGSSSSSAADLSAFLFGDELDDTGPGPWFEAAYEGTCSALADPIEPGDIIRADGNGGYEHEDCADDD